MSSEGCGLLRVVVADDDALIRLVIRSALESAGWDVHEVESGTEAQRRLASAPCDVIVLDAFMPGPGLPALVESISEHADAPAIIVLSGDATIASSVEALTLWGPRLRILTKPVDLDTLVETIAQVAECSESQHAGVQSAIGHSDDYA